ncbi:stage II sporulation protein D [Paenibacillus sp. 1P07SE]|uniref:stage II sporulation protein D n=1 Tax=Paenibacillus sp. 1P07SE TaxID=3132209 RepID=UPI0039A6B79E
MRILLGSRLGRWSAGAAAVTALLVLVLGLALRPSAPTNAVHGEGPVVEGQMSQTNMEPPPPATVDPGGDPAAELAEAEAALAQQSGVLDQLQVQVFLQEESRMEKVPLELYVRGVLAGEMPADFELEALKAQAIAARTYIIKQLAAGGAKGAGGGDVSDTVAHQVYVPLTKLSGRWPEEESAQALARLTRAVEETRGLIMTYKGKPIEASFFSTSNGYTENSEDYWTLSLPYLRSVPSPWDEALSPRFEQSVTLSLKEFRSKLGVKKGAEQTMQVLEHSDGNRIKSIAIGGQTFSGRQVRERLGLASSQFTWTVENGEIHFTTYGYGHGVGMSQWGANGMAKAGSQAQDILRHYYTGVTIEQASKLPAEF